MNVPYGGKPPQKPVLVNLGCGTIAHPKWHNFDLMPRVPGVVAIDASGRIPLPSGSVDACFSSHVLEHVPLDAARAFIDEQFRVLRPGGIIRVVVPDLEAVCVNYLAELRASRQGERESCFRYEYRVAELLCQMVRSSNRCRMVELWRSVPDKERGWVLAEAGYVAEADCMRGARAPYPAMGLGQRALRAIRSSVGRRKLWDTLRWAAVCGVAHALGGRRMRDFAREAAFRAQGEVHRWMYDSVSLTRLLSDSGFADLRREPLGHSRIGCWESYGLELRDGLPLKPGSLVIEGVKIGTGHASGGRRD